MRFKDLYNCSVDEYYIYLLHTNKMSKVRHFDNILAEREYWSCLALERELITQIKKHKLPFPHPQKLEESKAASARAKQEFIHKVKGGKMHWVI